MNSQYDPNILDLAKAKKEASTTSEGPFMTIAGPGELTKEYRINDSRYQGMPREYSPLK